MQLSLLLGEAQAGRAGHGAGAVLDEAGRAHGEGEAGEGLHGPAGRGPQPHAPLHHQPRVHGEDDQDAAEGWGGGCPANSQEGPPSRNYRLIH